MCGEQPRRVPAPIPRERYPYLLEEYEEDGVTVYSAQINITHSQLLEFDLRRRHGKLVLHITNSVYFQFEDFNVLVLETDLIRFILQTRETSEGTVKRPSGRTTLSVQHNDFGITYEQRQYDPAGHHIRWGRISVYENDVPLFKNILRECLHIMSH